MRGLQRGPLTTAPRVPIATILSGEWSCVASRSFMLIGDGLTRSESWQNVPSLTPRLNAEADPTTGNRRGKSEGYAANRWQVGLFGIEQGQCQNYPSYVNGIGWQRPQVGHVITSGVNGGLAQPPPSPLHLGPSIGKCQWRPEHIGSREDGQMILYRTGEHLRPWIWRLDYLKMKRAPKMAMDDEVHTIHEKPSFLRRSRCIYLHS